MVASDQVPDSPTNNFCTLNSIAPVIANTPTYSQGNLRIQSTWDSNWRSGISNFKMTSGKWYFEFRPIGGSYQIVGIASDESDATATTATQYLGKTTTGYGYQSSDGTVNNNASAVYTGSAYGTSNTIGVAVDLDNNKLYFAEDNTWQNSGDPTSGSTGTGAVSITDKDGYFIVVSVYETSSIGQLNFGQDSTFKGTISAGNNADGNGIGDFVYAPPSGYLALCSSNLPEPTIGPNSDEQANDFFDIVTWTGNGSSQNITSANFASDLVWTKTNSGGSNGVDHKIIDSVRGDTKTLESSSTDQETTDSGSVSSITSTGFSVGSYVGVNASSRGYIAWLWKGGTTSGIDTTGQDITPSGYSFNQDAGFSIVAYTGNKTDQQGVPHGLGAKPDWVVIKDRDNGSTQWVIAFPQISGNDYIYFTSAAKSTDSGNVFYFTPTTTTVEISDHDEVNKNSTKYIMYCFRSIAGYSKIGTYEGNASDDGTYVFCGFRPRFLWVKNIDANESGGASWIVYDTTRSTTNVMDDRLYLESANDTQTNANYNIDFLSNGFKIRDGSANYGFNNANTYTFYAVAEQGGPFKYANAR